MGNHISIPTSSKHTMKIFLLFVGLMAKETFCQKRITVDTRAPSTFQNCDCQCDSVTWTDGSTIKGNCRSQDKNGVLFCYISGRAVRACGDVQTSSFLPNNNGQLRHYSYNACTTPPRNECRNNNNFGNQNWGDGDYESNGGSNTYYPPSNIYRPGGSSSNSYRPGGSSSYRPGGSNSYRPGGSNSYRPGGSGLNLAGILGGIRAKGTSGSSGSSDGGSSNGAISFEA